MRTPTGTIGDRGRLCRNEDVLDGGGGFAVRFDVSEELVDVEGAFYDAS